jgi:hypothetical protein
MIRMLAREAPHCGPGRDHSSEQENRSDSLMAPLGDPWPGESGWGAQVAAGSYRSDVLLGAELNSCSREGRDEREAFLASLAVTVQYFRGCRRRYS